MGGQIGAETNGVREVFLSAPAMFGAHEAIIEENRSMSFYAVGSAGANIWIMSSKTFDKVSIAIYSF